MKHCVQHLGALTAHAHLPWRLGGETRPGCTRASKRRNAKSRPSHCCFLRTLPQSQHAGKIPQWQQQCNLALKNDLRRAPFCLALPQSTCLTCARDSCQVPHRNCCRAQVEWKGCWRRLQATGAWHLQPSSLPWWCCQQSSVRACDSCACCPSLAPQPFSPACAGLLPSLTGAVAGKGGSAIVFTGPEGAGKTTIVHKVRAPPTTPMHSGGHGQPHTHLPSCGRAMWRRLCCR